MSLTLMGQFDIPKYIRDILPNLRPTVYDEGGDVGYVWRLYGKHRIGFESQLKSEAERLVKWAKRYYADAYVIKEHFWYNDLPIAYQNKNYAYRTNHRNYITINITDPVAKQLEIAIGALT